MHPIRHKTNFGEKAGRIAVKFYNGSSVVTGWIAKQTGHKKFKVTANGTDFFFCVLAQTPSQLTALTAGTGPDAALRPNLCTIEVTPFGGSVEHVMNIQSKRLLTIEGSHLSYVTGTSAVASGTGTLAIVPNAAPVVANAIPTQNATVAGSWTFTVPANTFSDLNKDTLTLTATKGDGTALPAGFSFDGHTFTKTATSGSAGTLALMVTASDGSLTVAATFNLTLS